MTAEGELGVSGSLKRLPNWEFAISGCGACDMSRVQLCSLSCLPEAAHRRHSIYHFSETQRQVFISIKPNDRKCSHIVELVFCYVYWNVCSMCAMYSSVPRISYGDSVQVKRIEGIKTGVAVPTSPENTSHYLKSESKAEKRRDVLELHWIILPPPETITEPQGNHSLFSNLFFSVLGFFFL